MASKAEIGWRLFLAGLSAGGSAGCASSMQAEVLKQVSQGSSNAIVSPVETPVGATYNPEDKGVVVEGASTLKAISSPIRAEETPGARVAYKIVQLWSGPGSDYESVREIFKNEAVKVLGLTPDGKYAKVELSDGTVGYLSTDSRLLELNQAALESERLTEADLPATPTSEPTLVPRATRRPTEVVTPGAEVVAGGVNLRSGPGTNYDIVGGLKYGDKIEVIGLTQNGVWAKVKVTINGEEQEAFVSANSKYLKLNGAVKDLDYLDESALPPQPTVRPTEKRPDPTATVTRAANTPQPTAIRPTEIPKAPPTAKPEAPRQEVVRGIRPDVMEQIVAMYGSVNNMVGKEFMMNGGIELQDGSHPTYHSRVKWVKVIEDQGWKTSPDGLKKSHKLVVDNGGGQTMRLSILEDPNSESRPPIDPALFGVWGYYWNNFPGADGQPVRHLYNVALTRPGASLAHEVQVGQVVGVFPDDNPNNVIGNGTYSGYRLVVLN